MNSLKPTSKSANCGSTTRRAFLTSLGAFGLATAGTAQAGTLRIRGGGLQSDDRLFSDPESLEAFVDEQMNQRIGDVVPGAIVAIVEGDTPILTKGYGDANVEADVPVRGDETLFRVGSVGKLVTWTAVMQGVERGVLDLDADVNTYLRDSEVTVPDTYSEAVTLRHLGTHTAGFESTLDPELVTDPDTLAPLERVLADHQRSRIRPPGQLVGYSNYGAALAGHIVAEVHDTTFEEYVQSRILKPLEMCHSTFAQPVPDDYAETLAAGHTQRGETFGTGDDVYINMRPAGSMSATAEDMATFMSAYLGDGAVGDARILDADTARTMHERHHVRHPAVNNWRYGFHEYGHPDANLLSHSGATVYFKSRLVLAPDHDVGIFVGYNANTDTPSAVIDEILTEYDLQPSPATPSQTEKPDVQKRADTVTGEYSVTYLPQSGPLQVADLLEHISVKSTEDGRLVTETLNGEHRTWIETEPYVYHEVGGHDVIAFEVADGEVEAMNMSSEPTGVHLPVSLDERQITTGSVIGGSMAGFGVSLAGWGGRSVWRRWRQRRLNDNHDTEADE